MDPDFSDRPGGFRQRRPGRITAVHRAQQLQVGGEEIWQLLGVFELLAYFGAFGHQDMKSDGELDHLKKGTEESQ